MFVRLLSAQAVKGEPSEKVLDDVLKSGKEAVGPTNNVKLGYTVGGLVKSEKGWSAEGKV